MLNDPEMTARLRNRLTELAGRGPSTKYATDMWRAALDWWDHADAQGSRRKHGAANACEPFPYISPELESHGLCLGAGDCVMDVGCLGGYGLYDFARRRELKREPPPSLLGVDIDPVSIEIGRSMASVWDEGRKVRFETADSTRLPCGADSCDLLVACLLLPYVRVRETMSEVVRVLKGSGIVLFQVHAFGYYRAQFREGPGGNLRQRLYYARPMLSGLWFALALRQPRHRWFSETAMEAATLARLCRRAGLEAVWQDHQPRRPLMAFRKTAAPAETPAEARRQGSNRT